MSWIEKERKKGAPIIFNKNRQNKVTEKIATYDQPPHFPPVPRKEFTPLYFYQLGYTAGRYPPLPSRTGAQLPADNRNFIPNRFDIPASKLQ